MDNLNWTMTWTNLGIIIATSFGITFFVFIVLVILERFGIIRAPEDEER